MGVPVDVRSIHRIATGGNNVDFQKEIESCVKRRQIKKEVYNEGGHRGPPFVLVCL